MASDQSQFGLERYLTLFYGLALFLAFLAATFRKLSPLM